MLTLSVIIQLIITSKQAYSSTSPPPYQSINMQFFVAASLFAAALAAPVAQTPDCPNPAHCGPPDTTYYENIDISDYTLRRNGSAITSVNFKLSGDSAKNISCAIGATTLPSETITCGEPDSGYRFILIKPTDPSRDADIAIYHQTGQASGRWGEGYVPSYCHAGGDGPDDFICSQVGFYTMGIRS
jgi:hypothetical protein